MKNLKRILNVAFYAISIFLFMFVFFELLLPSKTIDYLGVKTYVVLTPSMEPDINVNDMIVVKKVDQNDIEVGDAITFEVYVRDFSRTIVVTHYVGAIETVDGQLIYQTISAKADAAEYDVWRNKDNEIINIQYEDIVGEVFITIPYIGHLVNVFRSPVMIGLIAFNIMIIYALVRVIKGQPKSST